MNFPKITNNCFVEVDYHQKYCSKQRTGGDVFLSRKLKQEHRVISVLSDGLGSGIKAGVLAILSAVMGVNYVSNFRDPAKAAKTIMDTLPVCSKRKISYSTFTLIDVDFDNELKIVEYDNPPVILVRQNQIFPLNREQIEITRSNKDTVNVNLVKTYAKAGDKVIVFSDGVSQSGIGSKDFPFGWGSEKAGEYILNLVKKEPDISARDLAVSVVDKAWLNNKAVALDDITCAVISFRQPRQLIVMTGPPYDERKDKLLANLVQNYPGKKIICGGTTANIVSRETGYDINVHLDRIDPELPPCSSMNGVDLITEGILTIGRVAKYLKEKRHPDNLESNAATKVLRLLLNSDIINFVVGTRVNEFHQDPNMPVELEIRRNVIKQIAALLETNYLKETNIQYI